MKKYKKIDCMEVLKKYYDEWNQCYGCGIWIDCISVECMAYLLGTSTYQVKKAYKKLAEQGFMELQRVPSHYDEYYNGLFTVTTPVLYTKAYLLTDKARKYFDVRKSGEYKISDLLEG